MTRAGSHGYRARLSFDTSTVGEGFAPRRTNASAGWTGITAAGLQEGTGGLTVGGRAGGRGGGLVNFGTPAYEAGLDSGDVIVSIDGAPTTGRVRRNSTPGRAPRVTNPRLRLSVSGLKSRGIPSSGAKP